MAKYDVRLYASTIVPILGVEAESQEEAIEKALDNTDLFSVIRQGGCTEYAEEVTDALVDEEGDKQYENSRLHNLRPWGLPDMVRVVLDRLDGLEIRYCAEFYDQVSDCCYTEQISGDPGVDETPANSTVTRKFYTVFGHLKTGGLDSICDCESAETANLIMWALKALM